MSLNTLIFEGFEEKDLPPEHWDKIKSVSNNVHLCKKGEAAERLKDADGLFVKLGYSVSKDTINSAPNLKLIGMYGTGYGRIDTTYAREKSIDVFNIADYATQAVAEFVFGALISHIREYPRALKQSESGDYSEATFSGSELSGKTLGIIGLGDIGQRVAQIAVEGFGMNVIYWSRTRRQELETENLRFSDLQDVASTSDILSFHLALTDETDGIFNESYVSKMKPGSVLINTAPMELLDLEAIENAVKNNKISLILDHSDEMKPEDVARINQYAGTDIFPPIAYTTKEADTRKQAIFVENIVAFAKGDSLPNLVN